MIRRPPRSTPLYSSAASDVYKRQGHPNNTTEKHLQTLFDLGFKRASFGVQDYDLKVQKAINRLQPYNRVEDVTNNCRKIGYKSVSHDLVFGLTHQTKEAIIDTCLLYTSPSPRD